MQIPGKPSKEGRKPRALLGWLFAAVVLLIALGSSFGAWIAWKYRVEPFPSFDHKYLPVPHDVDGELVLSMPNGNLVGLVGRYSDELTAFLRFQYLQSVKGFAGQTILMVTKEGVTEAEYQLYVLLPNSILAQSSQLAQIQIAGYIPFFELDSPPRSQIDDWYQQTRLFESAYQQPVRERLLQLPQSELTSAVAKFILFKTRTDRRMREKLEPVAGKALTPEDAQDFAADMIAVARFYDIPLDMLLGIGAMENNYLDVRGDLKHAVWKKHAHLGDIVLKRRAGKVLVSNYSLGPWQITRETLRYVHSLYLHDKRDYRLLPVRLRPSKTLDLDHIDTPVLTTYAGLLLRQLLDYFDGDVVKAQGAYNGGAGRSNQQYSDGVSMVSNYAHRVLSMAAGRKGNTVAETKLKVSND